MVILDKINKYYYSGTEKIHVINNVSAVLPDTGLVFMDALTTMERAADQCSSIAMLMLGRNNEEILKNHHLYLHELHHNGDQSYRAEMENRREQYLIPLKNIKENDENKK